MKYGWLGSDTLAALMSYEQEYYAYAGLDLSDSLIYIIKDVAHKYEQYGYSTEAAIALGTIINCLVERGDYQEAKNYMDKYESKSGRFDSKGNIEAGREIYYRSKGLYYLHTNRSDSAEFYLRKELRDGKDYNNQHAGAKGLAELYRKLNKPDSVAKYYQYAYSMNDSIHTKRTAKDVERIKAMYDYSRYQKEARMESDKANQREKIIWLGIGLLVILCFSIYIIISRQIYQRNEMEQKYMHSLSIISQAQNDILQLKTHIEENHNLIAEKEKIILEQNNIQKQCLQKSGNNKKLIDRLFKSSPIYKQFESMSIKGFTPTEEQWEELVKTIYGLYPTFHELMEQHRHSLNEKEFKTCILVKADFKPNMISNMLGVHPSYITNIRSKMLYSLFGDRGNSKKFDLNIKKTY